jgi:hypothetical protein
MAGLAGMGSVWTVVGWAVDARSFSGRMVGGVGDLRCARAGGPTWRGIVQDPTMPWRMVMISGVNAAPA